MNNMKQLALAAHNYLSSHRTFPAGWIENVNDPLPDYYFAGSTPCPNHPWTSCFPEPVVLPVATLTGREVLRLQSWTMSPRFGWHALLLPQMDQGTLVINFHGRVLNHDQNWKLIETTIPSYVCPSASLPSRRMHDKAYTTYRGNMGWWAQKDPNAPLENGIFSRNSGIGDRDITDGMSQTFLFGESLFGGYWGDSYACCARARDDQPNFDAHWSMKQPFYVAVCQNPGVPVDVHFFGFGSFHDNTTNFALSDGAVRSLAKNVDTNLFRALCTRNGRDLISQEF